ncbi:MAG TPA: hypothetical protein VFQ92_07155, partial [Blastocatellia bacterium]|nr:hypothetical protein [Blastocatellia bacterium]
MKKGLIHASIVAALFVFTSLVGADVRGLLEEKAEREEVKAAPTGRSISAIDARTYRSPGRLRKVVVESSDRETLSEATLAGAIELCDYGSFRLLAIDQAALDSLETSPRLKVRDDFNLLLLRSGVIDTTAGEGPGTLLGMGRRVRLGAAKHAPTDQAASRRGPRLRLVQFAGPVRSEWLDQLRASGLELVAYVPNNGYLVRGDER